MIVTSRYIGSDFYEVSLWRKTDNTTWNKTAVISNRTCSTSISAGNTLKTNYSDSATMMWSLYPICDF